nr:AAA-like domain-containing protein [Scytonema hofmannii]
MTVAEELSFSRAAVRLFISQPALSRQIKDLEDELGILLFLRKSHGLILTAAGKFFLEQAKDILNRSHVAVQSIKNNSTNIDEFLVVNCTPTILQTFQDNPQTIETTPAMPSAGFPRSRYVVLESPEGAVPLASCLYIERSNIEQTCYQEILQPRAFIRIFAPRNMGKTSLIARILDYGIRQNYHTVRLSLHHAGTQVFASSDRFLRWFCKNVTQQLGLESRLNDYWDEEMGALINSTIYFQGYLLKEVSNPIVLALDGIDQLFEYPEVASDFFVLLRSWYEETKDISVWQKLRIVIAHAVEVYIPLPTHRSPFNVGLAIKLPTFSPEQVQDLAERHGLQLTTPELEQLIKLTGGFPYLIQLALYQSTRLEMPLQTLLQDATTNTGIYQQHLQYQLWKQGVSSEIPNLPES